VGLESLLSVMQNRQPILQPTWTERQRVPRRSSGIHAASTNRRCRRQRGTSSFRPRTQSPSPGPPARLKSAPTGPRGHREAGWSSPRTSSRLSGRSIGELPPGVPGEAGLSGHLFEPGQRAADQVLLQSLHVVISEIDLGDDVGEFHTPADEDVARIDHHPAVAAEQEPLGRGERLCGKPRGGPPLVDAFPFSRVQQGRTAPS